MPRASSDPPHPRTETPATLRDMAARGRRLAHSIYDQKACEALTEFAQELEVRATALESAAQTFSHDEAAAVIRSDPDLCHS